MSLEAARTILDRHLGRPAIQADISLHRAEADGHIAALMEVARRRALEPIMLEDDRGRDNIHDDAFDGLILCHAHVEAVLDARSSRLSKQASWRRPAAAGCPASS